MKIGELAAMIYYYYANQAENHPEAWEIGNVVQDLKIVDSIALYLDEKLTAQSGESIDECDVLQMDFSESELLDAFYEVSHEGDCWPLDVWYDSNATPNRRREDRERQELEYMAHARKGWAFGQNGISEVYECRAGRRRAWRYITDGKPGGEVGQSKVFATREEAQAYADKKRDKVARKRERKALVNKLYTLAGQIENLGETPNPYDSTVTNEELRAYIAKLEQRKG